MFESKVTVPPEVSVAPSVPIAVIPAGSALLVPSTSAPPITFKSPVKLEELFPLSINIPSPIFVKPSAPVEPELMVPIKLSTPPTCAADSEPVLITAPPAVPPSTDRFPAKPSQPPPTVPCAPLRMFSVAPEPSDSLPVYTVPNCVPSVSRLSVTPSLTSTSAATRAARL